MDPKTNSNSEPQVEFNTSTPETKEPETFKLNSSPESDTNVTEDRPGWLPEKFKSAEDLAKAYSELEKRFSSKEPEAAKKPEGDKAPETKEADKKEDKDPTKIELDFQSFSNEIIEKGSLSEETFKSVTEAMRSDPEAFLNTWLDAIKPGLEAQSSEASDAITQDFYKTVGGQEKYEAVAQWAIDNVDSSTLDLYNKALDENNIDLAKHFLGQINAQYTKATGTEGRQVKGIPASGESSDVFTSQSQVTEAMRDPRYRGNRQDPAYIKAVEEKLARSRKYLS